VFSLSRSPVVEQPLGRTPPPSVSMRFHLLATVLIIGRLVLLESAALRAQEGQTGEGEVVTMEAFNVTAYGGQIKIVDGFTGKEYRGDNPLVFDFAESFNTLLIGFHKRLVLDEVKHMRYRLDLGTRFENEMNALCRAFEFREFALDRSTWLSRERSIVTRLLREPFFRIEALVVWDLDQLNTMAPGKPRNKYAADIHYNPDRKTWERRILTDWSVAFVRNANRVNGMFQTSKQQGLNLDTLAGFHFIDVGLPGDVPPHAFRDVKLTYPIFFSESEEGSAEALRGLQEKLVADLFFIYDPFSWVARRDTRFRGGFVREIREHIESQRLYVNDRKEFDGILAQFLSDVVTIKTQGVDEIYSLQMLQKRLGESPNWLGVKLDLLNWNPGEKRKARDEPEAVLPLGPGHPRGVRYVMIDAYQRFGDTLVDRIRAQLLALKGAREKAGGREMLQAIIAELAGMPYGEFAKRAIRVQQENLARHRITRSAPE
jgi:hypothetical protein